MVAPAARSFQRDARRGATSRGYPSGSRRRSKLEAAATDWPPQGRIPPVTVATRRRWCGPGWRVRLQTPGPGRAPGTAAAARWRRPHQSASPTAPPWCSCCAVIARVATSRPKAGRRREGRSARPQAPRARRWPAALIARRTSALAPAPRAPPLTSPTGQECVHARFEARSTTRRSHRSRAPSAVARLIDAGGSGRRRGGVGASARGAIETTCASRCSTARAGGEASRPLVGRAADDRRRGRDQVRRDQLAEATGPGWMVSASAGARQSRSARPVSSITWSRVYQPTCGCASSRCHAGRERSRRGVVGRPGDVRPRASDRQALRCADA